MAEPAIALLPIYQILVARAQAHRKPVLVVITTQVEPTAELFMEVTEALELMEVVHQEVETLLCTRIQTHLATTLSMERAFLNQRTTVHKLLVAEPAIALLPIYQILVARAQVLHSLDLVVITTQAQVLQ